MPRLCSRPPVFFSAFFAVDCALLAADLAPRATCICGAWLDTSCYRWGPALLPPGHHQWAVPAYLRHLRPCGSMPIAYVVEGQGAAAHLLGCRAGSTGSALVRLGRRLRCGHLACATETKARLWCLFLFLLLWGVAHSACPRLTYARNCKSLTCMQCIKRKMCTAMPKIEEGVGCNVRMHKGIW